MCIHILYSSSLYVYMTSGSLSPNSASPLRTPRARSSPSLPLHYTKPLHHPLVVTCPNFFFHKNQFHNQIGRHTHTKIMFNRSLPNLTVAVTTRQRENRRPFFAACDCSTIIIWCYVLYIIVAVCWWWLLWRRRRWWC